MDGTIVDSNAVVERTWAVWAARYSLPLDEILAYSHGRPTLATMRHFGARIDPYKDWSAEADRMQAIEEGQSEGTKPIPGALELLNSLDGEPWAVVTSAPRSLAESRIIAAGLPLPSVMVPADEISKGKPDPEGFLKAAQLLGALPHDCIVFEDTPPGVEAGLAAGMAVIALLTTFPANRLRTEYTIRDYSDLRITQSGRRFSVDLLDQ